MVWEVDFITLFYREINWGLRAHSKQWARFLLRSVSPVFLLFLNVASRLHVISVPNLFSVLVTEPSILEFPHEGTIGSILSLWCNFYSRHSLELWDDNSLSIITCTVSSCIQILPLGLRELTLTSFPLTFTQVWGKCTETQRHGHTDTYTQTNKQINVI